MEAAQSAVQTEGRGVIIWLDQEGKGNGHLALIESIKYKKQFGQAEAYVRAGYSDDARSYRPAAQILEDLGIRSIVLLTDNAEKSNDLVKESVKVSSVRPLLVKN